MAKSIGGKFPMNKSVGASGKMGKNPKPMSSKASPLGKK